VTNNDPLFDKTEDTPENLSLDCIIQHAPVEYLAIQKYTKNIAIPIMQNKISKMPYNQNYQKLNLFDNILVENEQDKNLLIKSNVSCPISVFDESLSDKDILPHVNKSYNLGERMNGVFVFGFIGAYKQNISIIQKIITAFLVSFRSSSDVSLIMSCRGTEQDKKELESYYDDLKKRLSIIEYSNILFIFSGLDIESSVASLNSFSCLLSINDDNSQYLYEKYIASKGISLITKHSVENIQVPPVFINESHDIDDILISISTADLGQKMKDIKNQQGPNKHQKIKKNNAKNLGETVCHILQ
jgi:glutaredoxin